MLPSSARALRRLRPVRVSIVIMAAMLALTGMAQAAPTRVSTFSGDGATAFNRFIASGREEDGNPYHASGYIKGSPTGANGVLNFNGPIVCLDIRGNQVGAIYRFDDTSKPPRLNDGLYLYITGIDGGPGGVDFAGFAGPFPRDPRLGCAPNPALNTFGPVIRGDLAVHDGR